MVVDFRVRAPDKAALEMPEKFSQYFHIFEEQFEFNGEIPEKEWIDNMQASGVKTAVVTAEDTETTTGKHITNDEIAALVDRHPELLVGFASVDPHKGMDAVTELERAVIDLGMEGVIVWPPFHEIPTTDRRYYPIYAKAAELDIPIIIHSSAHFNPEAPMDIGHPKKVDTLAADFPDTPIICSHAGWPWVMSAITVALRHPNVYLETSAIRPRYMRTAAPDITDGFGASASWETFLEYAQTTLQDRIIFGTGKPVRTWEPILSEFDDLPIDDETKQKWLTDNASRLLDGS